MFHLTLFFICSPFTFWALKSLLLVCFVVRSLLCYKCANTKITHTPFPKHPCGHFPDCAYSFYSFPVTLSFVVMLSFSPLSFIHLSHFLNISVTSSGSIDIRIIKFFYMPATIFTLDFVLWYSSNTSLVNLCGILCHCMSFQLLVLECWQMPF